MAYSVLLIDDEFDVRDLLARSLEREGFVVQTAGNGQDGLDCLRESEYDLLITDLHMPVVDGNVLLETIQDSHRDMIRVVVTGFGDTENIKRALNANTDHLIEKPVDVMSLHLLLHKLLKEREARFGDFDDDRLDGLTQRLYELRLESLNVTDGQRLLVSYILKGMSNKSISRVTGRSEQVVKNAISNLYRKLEISSRSQLFHIVFPI